jgi:hypothetical protein
MGRRFNVRVDVLAAIISGFQAGSIAGAVTPVTLPLWDGIRETPSARIGYGFLF